ncbi:hypothetical protein ACHQM5_020939 [Ranunculus cassubicifolius]
MSSKTPSPSSTDLSLKPQKNETMSTESDVKPSEDEKLKKQPQEASSPEKSLIELAEIVKPSEEELLKQPQEASSSAESVKSSEEELLKQPQEASSPEEKSLIELAESVYAIPKGPGTIEQKIDQFLDVFAKLEKQGCEVGEILKLLETAKESPADFANVHTLPSEFVEAFGKLESIGLRMIEIAKAGVMEIIKDETLISDLSESMDMLSQLNKQDLGPNVGALAKCVEKNLNEFIELVNAEKMRKCREKIKNILEKHVRLLEKRNEEKVRADYVVFFICFYFLCVSFGGVAFIISKFH